MQTLRCQASGNPVPKLDCHRKGDGALLPVGELRPVTRDISGTYVCQATSRRGVVTREVVVHVICECQCWGLAWVGQGRRAWLYPHLPLLFSLQITRVAWSPSLQWQLSSCASRAQWA